MAEYISPLREFLESYPVASGESISISPINYLDIDQSRWENPNSPQGAAIIVTGGTSSMSKDVTESITRDYQVDFNLAVRRYTNDNALRKELADFLIDYRLWIDDEQDKRGTPEESPLLPQFGDDPKYERIQCNGGTQTGVALQEGLDEYTLQINIFFRKIRKRPLESW